MSAFYEPFTAKLQLAVKHLNEDLISGAATALSFDAYIELLVAKVSEPVAA